MDARPVGNLRIPHETYLPLLIAAGLVVFFLGLLINATFVGAAGVVFAAVGILWWTWRTDMDLR
jgi:membrane associated rhomboid family serine protease